MEKLDHIVERVESEFTAHIQELNNSEVEYVLEQLISFFENCQNHIQAGSRD